MLHRSLLVALETYVHPQVISWSKHRLQQHLGPFSSMLCEPALLCLFLVWFCLDKNKSALAQLMLEGFARADSDRLVLSAIVPVMQVLNY